jgi:hypothetical protein
VAGADPRSAVEFRLFTQVVVQDGQLTSPLEATVFGARDAVVVTGLILIAWRAVQAAKRVEGILAQFGGIVLPVVTADLLCTAKAFLRELSHGKSLNEARIARIALAVGRDIAELCTRDLIHCATLNQARIGAVDAAVAVEVSALADVSDSIAVSVRLVVLTDAIDHFGTVVDSVVDLVAVEVAQDRRGIEGEETYGASRPTSPFPSRTSVLCASKRLDHGESPVEGDSGTRRACKKPEYESFRDKRLGDATARNGSMSKGRSAIHKRPLCSYHVIPSMVISPPGLPIFKSGLLVVSTAFPPGRS